MLIQIKKADTSNLDAINHLIRLSKSHWKYEEEFLDRFMEKFSITHEYLKNNFAKLLYYKKNLIGFCSFVMHQDNTLELDNFFIHPDYIGQGFGRELWKICCTSAAELEKNEFIIWSDPHADNFYLEMGCEKIGVRASPMLPDRFPTVFKYKIY